ncbi:MAG TPA: DUF924 family protein [Elainellaceae cyanobacterium]
MAEVSDVLEFWFGDPSSKDAEYEQRRKLWFGKQETVDQEIRERFGATYDRATSGQLDAWEKSPDGCLALVIVLDQFPRNMFRGDPKAFATDAKALAVSQWAIAQHFDQAIAAIRRFFLYVPFEHSEQLTHQNQSVEYFAQLINDAPELADTYSYAIRHRQVIERFGRFPHRNSILGRNSTPEEREFLKQPGSSF